MNSGFHFLSIQLLHDSLSDEISYKTVKFAGYEHSFQAPYRHQERKCVRERERQKKFTLISALLHKLTEIDLLITGKAVHGFSQDSSHFFPCAHEYRCCLISQNTESGQKERERERESVCCRSLLKLWLTF